MHKLKRKNYVSPESVVTHVELESPICSGSADFVGEEASGVNIQAQDVTTPTYNVLTYTPTFNESENRNANDFSGSAWGTGL